MTKVTGRRLSTGTTAHARHGRFTLPTLDPFLLKCKAQQTGIEDQLNPAYFNITLEEWNRIQQPIRLKKSRRWCSKALGLREREDAGAKIEAHVSKFLKKIWEARDIDGIEDFVHSMDMPPDDRAPELFFAWKAICYYQVQFSLRSSRILAQALCTWVGDPKMSLPADLGGLRHETFRIRSNGGNSSCSADASARKLSEHPADPEELRRELPAVHRGRPKPGRLQEPS